MQHRGGIRVMSLQALTNIDVIHDTQNELSHFQQGSITFSAKSSSVSSGKTVAQMMQRRSRFVGSPGCCSAVVDETDAIAGTPGPSWETSIDIRPCSTRNKSKAAVSSCSLLTAMEVATVADVGAGVLFRRRITAENVVEDLTRISS